MVSIGTPNTGSATRLMLLGSGELGRETAIAAMRLGLEVIAVDRYPNAPAMQVAQHSHVLSMLDGEALRALIEREKPDLIVPEIEAIATDTLLELEREGYKVIPSANAVKQTMNREGIRRLAAELLGLPTSSYCFAGTVNEFKTAIEQIGLPCLVKPVMSSSGKGQSLLRSPEQVEQAWVKAQEEGRAGQGRVIVEGFVDFDYEITLLTVRHAGGVSFCEPIGHYQQDGDYRLSWQPQPMPVETLAKARDIAARITAALGGWGLFGVELFIKNGANGQPDQVYFSEISPRPHDTGLVTCIGQDLSEFALHVRAILGLPIPAIRQYGPAASAALLGQGHSLQPLFHDLDLALQEPDTDVMLFGKPELSGKRRLGVALALGATIEEAKTKAQKVAETVRLEL